MSKEIHGLAVDIDETLSNTNYYWISELTKLFGNPENLSHEEIIERYRYTQHVPFWQSDEALAWMERGRNSDEMQELFPLIENANHMVEKINALIPIAAYITARPSSVVGGTKRWLDKHGFPPAEIIARPAGLPHREGNQWKAALLHALYPRVQGIIDDNVSLVEHLPADYQGVVFLYNHDTSPRSDINVIACKKWEAVLAAVEKQFN